MFRYPGTLLAGMVAEFGNDKGELRLWEARTSEFKTAVKRGASDAPLTTYLT